MVTVGAYDEMVKETLIVIVNNSRRIITYVVYSRYFLIMITLDGQKLCTCCGNFSIIIPGHDNLNSIMLTTIF